MGSVALEEFELQNDSKYKLYVASVDKALKSFEYTSEWADLISALGKLNKILLNHQKYPVIPRRMKISKRLAQCLHPELPSGVHLKALETYDIMFKTMGMSRLSQELFIYSSGLFPVLGHAATNVKPSLLNIYENHFVPLGEKLVPGLNGFLSGVLPGLEEGTDYYERTNLLLEKVCQRVSADKFYTCLWECLVSNAAVRLPAIIFILSHFDRHFPMREQQFLMGNDVNVLVKGLCTCFQDESVLIQRSALDFLLVGFPMHDTSLSEEHRRVLITYALYTLLRRDMSLNRRLFAWLLGSDVTSNVNKVILENSKSSCDNVKITETVDQYFKIYSKNLLVSAIKCMLKSVTSNNPHDLRPYRILISLLDKSDIGPVILDDILFEVFRLLYLCWQNPGNAASNGQELLKSANLLFSSLEPRYLWQYVGLLFFEACCRIPTSVLFSNSECEVKSVDSGDPSLMEVCSVIIFLLDSLSLEIYSETFSEYLPELFLHIISSLTDHCDTLNAVQLNFSLKLCLKILSKIRSPILISQTNSVCNNERFGQDGFVSKESKVAEPGRIIQLQTSDQEKCRETDSSRDRRIKIIKKSVFPETDNDNEISTHNENEETANSNEKSLNQEEFSTMEKCLHNYKKFYVTFMYIVRLKLGETKSVSNLFDSLVIKSPEVAAEDKIKQLELLLLRILYNNNSSSTHNSSISNLINLENHKCNCNGNVEDCCFASYCSKETIDLDWQEPVSNASKLLTELSTFQTSTPLKGLLRDTFRVNDEENLPDWLKSLITCACWLGNTSIPLQLVAISTLLDLSFLCRRAQLHTEQSTMENANTVSPTKTTTNQVVTVVVFVPLLALNQLIFIESNTNVFQVIIHWLWLHLANPVYEIKCAELICQLQNTLRIPDIVEDCIGESLSNIQSASKKLESFRKFIKLWHISREIIKRDSSSRIEDSLYKCMLKILDNLHTGENNYLKLEAENWLFHSLLRGDCSRIIDPLLLILLDRKTARVGVKHARIQQLSRFDNTSTATETNNSIIFVIYSAFGNTVTYHTCRHFHPKNSKPIYCTIPSNDKSLFKNVCATDENKSDENAHKVDTQNLSYLQSTPIFINRISSIDESTNMSQVAVSDFDYDKFENNELSDSFQKYNTLPIIRDKLYKNDAKEKKCASFSSLETVKNDTSLTSYESSSSHSNVPSIVESGIVCDDEKYNSIDVKISRAFVSDDGLANKERNSDDTKTIDLTRSSSFSGRNISNKNFKDDKCLSQYASNNGISNLLVAKAVIEDIIKEIVDHVIDKKVDSINPERGEEADSAISCTSGCSSVTLELEKDNLNNDDFDHMYQKANEETESKKIESVNFNAISVQFFSHILLYSDIYDKNRILYIIEKFRTILCTNAKSFLFITSTSIIPSHISLVNLLLKHRNSIFAKGFQCSDKSEMFHKNTTYLEVLIVICLYYVRSYYPNFGNAQLVDTEIIGNKQVQLESTDLLTQIFFQLCRIVSPNENEMILYIRGLLNRCKVQKIALHCTYCYLMDDNLPNLHVFIKEVILFNKEKNQLDDVSNDYNQTFQIHFLRLLLSLIILENELYTKEDTSVSKTENSDDFSYKYDYISYKPIIQQPLFFNLLKKLLEPDIHRRPIHERVISFIIACLPYLKKSLSKIVVHVAQLLCCNIEIISDVYIKSVDYRMKLKLPVNYMVTLMDAVTILSHYCLLDFNSQLFLKPVSETLLGSFKDLFHMYSDYPSSTFQNYNVNQSNDYYQEAKESILDNLPKIFASVSSLWSTITQSKQREYENEAGCLPVVKNQILNLLNPIASNHSTQFFISVAIVWKEKMSFVENNNEKFLGISRPNKDQLTLVHLLSSLTSVTPDLLINSVYRVIKPPSSSSHDKGIEIEISILEVLVHYIQLLTIAKLTDCWNSLVPLLREASNVTIQSQFLLCAAVHYFVRRLPSTPDHSMDRKDFKDLQEIIVKLVEICTQIAGACLEQTTWLRRNLAVRDNNTIVNTGVLTNNILFGKDSDKQSGMAPHYSGHAQLLLADVLIPLLDLIFINQDKEKSVVILINVMYNITPYLKNHTQKNTNNFHACSQVLATITSYHYTKKAWKKDVMELLLDQCLFQMEIRSLKHWRTIVANLMCHEISTFRDLLNRVSMNQNNALNLFSSKEQEYEQRSQLLKRLAFVILCCENDQFHKHMPDIQEKLADSLKLPQSTPGIQAQVFLCFRVLLLRMSPHHITSLWPVIITEMVQVMLQMEYELSADIDESGSQSRIFSSNDWLSINNTNNGPHPHWLQLQLAAAKLLKLAVQLPASKLPQFQMYRWAFVGKYQSSLANSNIVENNSADFVPHVIRIAFLMNTKYGKCPENNYENLLPASSNIKTHQDLHSFFAALSQGNIREVNDASHLEDEIEVDFLEQLPYSSFSTQLK